MKIDPYLDKLESNREKYIITEGFNSISWYLKDDITDDIPNRVIFRSENTFVDISYLKKVRTGIFIEHLLFRNTGPAKIVYSNKEDTLKLYWYEKPGRLHRINGPAAIYVDDYTKNNQNIHTEWIINGSRKYHIADFVKNNQFNAIPTPDEMMILKMTFLELNA